MTEDFYGNPDNLLPVGPAHRRQRPIMSGMVPVRFPEDMIAAVKRFASQDGMTVSTWIRRLVAKEIKRREPPATTTTSAEQIHVKIHASDVSRPVSSTAPAQVLELIA